MRQHHKLAKVCANSSVFLECDIQGKFGNLLKNYEFVAQNGLKLTKVANLLDIPLISTKMVNLGPIDERITEQHNHKTLEIEKKTWSMLGREGDQPVLDWLQKHNQRKQAILYGMVTQVCVRTTAQDLLEMGYDVHLVTDCVTSIEWHDRRVALEQMAEEGVQMTTVETLVYELMGSSDFSKFSEIRDIMRTGWIGSDKQLLWKPLDDLKI